MSTLELSCGALATGTLLLAIAILAWRDTGPGSGFKGYTLGHRIFLWLTFAFALAHIAAGIVGLRHHLSSERKPTTQAPRE